MTLAQHGTEITQPSDIIRDPYVFEFLGIPEVNDADDNPPIGIILCTDKDIITAEYAQIEAVLKKWHGEDKPE